MGWTFVVIGAGLATFQTARLRTGLAMLVVVWLVLALVTKNGSLVAAKVTTHLKDRFLGGGMWATTEQSSDRPPPLAISMSNYRVRNSRPKRIFSL